MSLSSTRAIGITFTGAFEANYNLASAANSSTPGVDEIKALTTGANTITVPSVTGFTANGVTIVPPSGNTVLMTLKGVSGDTGIPLHKTDPTSVGLDTTSATFVINAASGINGVRFIWT